jgi:hypothetical protein
VPPSTAEQPRPASSSLVAPPEYAWCDEEALAASSLSREVAALEEAVPSAATDEQARALFARIQALEEEPCFRLAPKVRLTAEQANLLGLRWFWAHGGSEWIRLAEHVSQREIVVPGPIPEAPTLKRASEWARAGLVCRAADPACGAEARAWAQRAERTINAIGRRWPYSRPKPCRERAGLRSGESAYDAWLECRVAAAGQVWVFPIAPLAAPSDGILFSRGESRQCAEWRMFDVASGAGIWAQRCGARAPVVSLGRIDSRLLQEAVFVASLTDHVQSGPAHQRLIVPDDISLSSTLGAFPEGFEIAVTASSIQVSHRWTYALRDQTLSEGELKWPEDLNAPERTYAAWSFDAVDATWQSECGRGRPYHVLIDALAREAPRATSAISSLRNALKSNRCGTLPKPERLGYRPGWQSSGLSLEEPFEFPE